MGEAGLGAGEHPGGERERGRRHHRGHEPGRDGVGETLDRGAAALRLGDLLDDAGEERVAADLLRAEDEAARAVQRAAGDALAVRLLDRDGLAGDRRLVDRARTLDHGPVDRDPLARPHAQEIAGVDRVEGHVGLAAVGLEPAGRGRGELQQSADGAPGAGAGAQLEHLADEDEGDDHRGRLEVDRDPALVTAGGVGEQARRENGGDAVEPRDTGANPNEREHVESPRAEARPHPIEEGPPRPQHDGRREEELDEARRRRGREALEPQARDHRRHRQDEERSGERRRDPEPPRHVVELGVLLVGRGDGARLEGHTADRAGPGLRLEDLGVHGADPLDGPVEGGGRGSRRGRGRSHRRHRGAPLEPVPRVRRETLAAARVAEPVRLPLVLVRAATRLRDVDLHPADGVRLQSNAPRTAQLHPRRLAHGPLRLSPRTGPARRGAPRPWPADRTRSRCARRARRSARRAGARQSPPPA